MKRMLMGIVCVLVTGAAVTAQSNEALDTLLSQKAVNLGQAAYLVLVASENLSQDADETRAFERLESLLWAPKASRAADPVSLDRYAYILMQAFDMKGSLLYTLFPSPRYAYRSLCSMQVIQGTSDPDTAPDGETAIRLLGRILDLKGVSR